MTAARREVNYLSSFLSAETGDKFSRILGTREKMDGGFLGNEGGVYRPRLRTFQLSSFQPISFSFSSPGFFF
jgi:hypothetical protein